MENRLSRHLPLLVFFALFASVGYSQHVTWEWVPLSIDSGGTSSYIGNLATDGDTFYAGVLGQSAANGLFRLPKGAKTFERLNIEPASSVYSIAFGHPSWISTSDGIYVSKDGSEPWTKPETSFIPSGTIVASGSSALISNNEGVYGSTDSGKTWSGVVPVENGYFLDAGTIASDGMVTATTILRDGDLLISTNFGVTWLKRTQLAQSPLAMTVASGTVFALCGDSVWRSLDTGLTWQAVARSQDAWAIAARGRDVIVSSDTSGVKLSTDLGTSWLDITAGIPGRGGGSVTIGATEIFACVFPQGGIVRAALSSLAVPRGSVAIQDEPISVFPNPATSSVKIHYSLYRASTVTIVLFDALGREVWATTTDDPQNEGDHETMIDTRGLSSEVYSCRVSAGSAVRVLKLAIMK